MVTFKYFKVLLLFTLFLFSGCYMNDAAVIYQNIPLQPVNLAGGSRIIIGETTPGFSTYTIDKFGQQFNSTNMEIVHPPDGKYEGAILAEIAKKMLAEMDAEMAFLAVMKTQRKLYREKDNSAKDAPHLNLYQYTAADVYQYDNKGNLIGRSLFSKSTPWPKDFSLHGKLFVSLDLAKHTENLSDDPAVYKAHTLPDKIVLCDVRVELQKWYHQNL